jgi:hypothetical protein
MTNQEAIRQATIAHSEGVQAAADRYYEATDALTDAWGADIDSDDGAYLASVAPMRAAHEGELTTANAQYIAAVRAASGG